MARRRPPAAGIHPSNQVPVGTIANVFAGERLKPSGPMRDAITIRYPSRLNAMAIDPSRIGVTTDGRYNAGEVVFAIDLCTDVAVRRIQTGTALSVTGQTKRPTLVRHAAHLMQAAIGYSTGLEISVGNRHELRHVGLGSSSGLIAAVGAAINELFGCPLPAGDLLRYLAQNHVEEIDGSNDYVTPVQCLGGSAAAGLYQGGILVLCGENTVIAAADISGDYTVLIGIPRDYQDQDALTLMAAERQALPGFVRTGITYGPSIAYQVLHIMLPALARQRLPPIGAVVYDYRFNLGSINNCSFVYYRLNEVAELIKPIYQRGLADVLSLSSVGPGFFAITRQPDDCSRIMQAAGLKITTTRLHNAPYQVLE